MTESRHHLRAATSLRRALELIGRACAEHHGQPEQAPPDPLDGLPTDCIADVGRALGTLLDHLLGPEESLRRLLTVDAFDMDAVATLVAEASDWDASMALRAHALAVQHHRDYVDLASVQETAEPTYLTEEQRHDALVPFDLATAAGVASGRYVLTREDGDDEATMQKGPRFDDDDSLSDDPALRWIQVWLDNYLDRADDQ